MTTGSKTPGVPLENIETHDSLDEVASLFVRYSKWAWDSVPVRKLRSTEGSGPIFADKQSQVAV